MPAESKGDDGRGQAEVKTTVSENENADEDIVQSQSREYLSLKKYSFEWFENKPDMELTKINNVVKYKPTKSMRKTAVDSAIKNAKEIGSIDERGAVSVHVDDIDSDVMLSKKSLEHGLDRRFSENLPATLKAGEILKNAIKVNELNPKIETAESSYILVGAAQSSDALSIVEFVVNKFTNEVDSIDVLYSINTKKEAAVLNAPPPTNNSLRITASKISIPQLLEYVNKYFPDILPEDILRHFGHDGRPEGTLGGSVLYQQRTNGISDSLSDRDVLEYAAEEMSTETLSPGEAEALKIFKKRMDEVKTLQAKRAELAKLYKEQQFGEKVDRAEAQKTLNRMKGRMAHITTKDMSIIIM